jgi:hypothetical protein
MWGMQAVAPFEADGERHGRMTRGGQGLPKVSTGPAMPYPFTPWEQATPETAASGVAHPQGWRPAAVFYPLGHPTPYAMVKGR